MSPLIHKLMYKFLLAILLFFYLFFRPSTTQAQQAPFDLGFEFQAYPTGLIPGIRFEKAFKQHNAIHLRLGYNWIRHQGYGVQDDERGDGYGGTLGYKYYFKENYQGWFLGAKTDIWFNTVDWENYDDTGAVTERGTTELTVIQPTLEGGYSFDLGNGNWIFAPSLAFGFEINVETKGEETGQGPIVLLGFTFSKRFGQ